MKPNSKIHYLITLFTFLTALPIFANLEVRLVESDTVASKKFLTMVISNSFPERIEGFRATVFLFDEAGKVTGTSTKWIIGGNSSKLQLRQEEGMKFYWPVNANSSFSKCKIVANRIVLENGKLGDIKLVQIADSYTGTDQKH